MATTGVRLTIKFDLDQQRLKTGWSESYDLNFADIPTAIAAQAQLDNFVKLRAYCLGAGVTIVSCVLTGYPGGVIVPPSVRRATVAFEPPIANTAGTHGAYYNPDLAGYLADYAVTVLLFRVQTNPSTVPQYQRSVWIAGIPDDCDQTGSLLPINGPWNTAFEKFRQQMSFTPNKIGGAASIMAIRSLDRSGANPIHLATGYNIATNVFTVPAHGFVNGQLIEAIGFRGKAGSFRPSGYYKVMFVDANSFSLVGSSVTTTQVPPGGFRAVVYVWNSAFNATMEGFSKRNKGRPFVLEVGRRRIPTRLRA